MARFCARVALILAAGSLCIGADCAELPRKPAVPAGRDPGGIGIALVGPGVAYTAPTIAARIARDGEGEIIGFDLIDGDRRPYSDPAGGEASAIIVRQSAHSRLMVFRADPANRASMLQGLGMAALSPADIVAVEDAPGAILGGDGLAALSARFESRLVIVAVNASASGTGAGAVFANVLTVRGCEAGAPRCGWTWDQDNGVDIVVPVASIRPAAPLEAAAPVAALAARIWAAEPALKGDAVKTRILALGQPFADGQNHGARGGWIADPAAHLAGM